MITNVSIVIPSYKAESFIGRTLESLLYAQVSPENIFVIEDGVFDDTANVVKKFSKVNHIQLKENRGAPNARNEGLKLVKTKFIMFIDSDDYVSEELIFGLLICAIEENANITFGPWRFAGEKMGDGPINFPTKLPSEQWVTRWLSTEFVPPCSVMWATEFVNLIGGWNTLLKQNQDGELVIRGLMHTKSISFSTRGYGVYWQHSSPDRVSRASEEGRLLSANIIFNQVSPWLQNRALDNDAKKKLGAFCIMQYWNSVASNTSTEEAGIWKKRALELGYKKKGYNTKTNLISTIFGVKVSLAIRRNIHRPWLYFRKR